jgi:hypothetical protein
MTAYWRKKIGIEKSPPGLRRRAGSHPNDAIAMVTRNYMPTIASLEYKILPKRAKVWEDNPTKQSQEKMGFRHYDLVKAKHRKKGLPLSEAKGWIVGSIRALKATVITLRTKENSNFPVSYRKSRLLYRFNRIIYSY